MPPDWASSPLVQWLRALAAMGDERWAERYGPDDPEIVHSRAMVYACATRVPEAIATFKQFARRWPRQARRFEVRQTIR